VQVAVVVDEVGVVVEVVMMLSTIHVSWFPSICVYDCECALWLHRL
jgi:hypothetical protein